MSNHSPTPVNRAFITQVYRFPESQHQAKAAAFIASLTFTEFNMLTIAQADPYKAEFIAAGKPHSRRSYL
jgi:hypothetical protein